MKTKRLYFIIALLIIASTILSACQGTDPSTAEGFYVYDGKVNSSCFRSGEAVTLDPIFAGLYWISINGLGEVTWLNKTVYLSGVQAQLVSEARGLTLLVWCGE